MQSEATKAMNKNENENTVNNNAEAAETHGGNASQGMISEI